MIKDVQLNFNQTISELKKTHKISPDDDHYHQLISTFHDLNKRSETFSVVIQVTAMRNLSAINVPTNPLKDWVQSLTKREAEVFSLAIKGYSNKSISDKLFIAIETVKSHRKNIVRKAGVTKIDDIKNQILEGHNFLE